MKKITMIGEIMLRLSPPYYNKIEQATNFNSTYGGGEANVAISLSRLGHQTKFISKLPKNQLGYSALKHLRSYNVDVEDIILEGDNIGIYFLEMGFGGRSSQVLYNRKYSAFTSIDFCQYDFNSILKNTSWLHLSGITLALSESAKNLAINVAQMAYKSGIKVSFDFNYRSKLWTIEEASMVLKQIIPYTHVCFANLFDIETLIGINCSLDTTEDKMDIILSQFIEKYQIDYVFGTKRQIHSANENSLSAYSYSKDNKYLTNEYKFNIVDRIGGGDAFVSGVVHGLLKNYKDYTFATEFGLATSVLKHTIQGDACILSEEEILNFINHSGKANIDR